MERTLSSNVAPHAFGMALLCAGQLSTFTGTISGQVQEKGCKRFCKDAFTRAHNFLGPRLAFNGCKERGCLQPSMARTVPEGLDAL
eukprot:1150046-Pelagomonas_calceolata.AAC.6